MKSFLAILLIISFLTPSSLVIHAQTADEIQAKIQARNDDIAKLEAEIKTYQAEIDALGTKAMSLSATIKQLDLSRKQLESKIAVTEDKISAKNYEIQQLAKKISAKQGNIEDDRRMIRQAFKSMQETGDYSTITVMLGSGSLAEAVDSLNSLGILENDLFGKINRLSDDKAALETNQQASVKAKAELVTLNDQLSDQRSIILATASEKGTLLKQTSQSETTFRKIVADKQAEEAALQQEINQYERQLHLLVHPNEIPAAGSGVLAWPLDSKKITQYFGNTPFASANPQVYGGMGHNGVDFAASIGTPVKASLSGVVVGVENTDAYPGCYSFGKWIMIRHDNGLSTLYAHLSLQIVRVGDRVTTGQMIGYSGNTGYSTGPHLHFGVYATVGTVIKKFTNSRNCQGATIPIADFSAYLNPLSYL